MMKYYRFTNSSSPMSDWGHAMFAEDRNAVEHYGQNEYTLDKAHTVSIYELEEIIKEAWENDPCSGYAHLAADEAFDEFCPEDIVNSAQAFDCELVCWLWDVVLLPKNILAVRTQDGAICFDESLIQKVGA
ncbi:hypothetical protein ACTID9_01145 [Brevibacillus fluminis]|uniref:hypothetical protein n=1 Tax=Brevibacillus fluminis TaxID=511487 RepID=UPI003F8AE4EA